MSLPRRDDGIYLRGRTWWLLAVAALAVLWGGSALAESPAGGAGAYQFAEAVIWSLGDAHLADSRSQDATQTLEAQLVALRVAAGDLRRAATALETFTSSPDTIIREPAQLIQTAYLGLAQSYDETAADVIRLLQEAIQTRSSVAEAQVRALDVMTAAVAKQRELWLVMGQAVALSTYALLDPPAKPGERYKRLRLTAAQRTALLGRLERSFGRDVMISEKLIPGTSWPQAAGKTVHKFLSDTTWPSLDAK